MKTKPTHKRFKDIEGQRFGRWLAVSFVEMKGGALWLCRCLCGTERAVKAASLLNGLTKSCGCRRRELAAELGHRNAGARHGCEREYSAWSQMIQRCTNNKHKQWPRFGGRGITVYGKWLESFEAFLADMGPRPSVEVSLRRIREGGNYEPGNVVWRERDQIIGDDPLTLRCSRCHEDKPIEQFRKRPNRSPTGKRRGRWSRCIACEKFESNTPRRREMANTAVRRFIRKLKTEEPQEYQRRLHKYNLRARYGLTLEQYDLMLTAQGGGCAICGMSCIGNNWSRRFHIDHDHVTGTIRGLLCSGCNAGLGLFKEDKQRLMKAVAYLDKQTGEI